MQLLGQRRAEEEHHCRLMGGKRADGFAFGHGRFARGSCDDDRLADVRERILRAKRGRRAAKCAHAGADIVGNSKLLQPVKLLTHGTIDAGVSGVEADGGFPRGLRFLDDGNDLLKGHFCAVVDFAVLSCIGQKLRVYQRPRVDDHVRLLEQALSPHGDEIGRAASRADKMYHKLCLPYLLQQSLRAAGLAQAAIFLGKNHCADLHLAAFMP